MTESLWENNMESKLKLARESISPSVLKVVKSIIRRSEELIKKPNYPDLPFTDKILYRTWALLYTKNPIEYQSILEEWGRFKENIWFPFWFAHEEQVLIFIIYFDFHNWNPQILERYLVESPLSKAITPELKNFIINQFNKVSSKKFPKK